MQYLHLLQHLLKLKHRIIPIVGPIGVGILRPASRISSNEISIINISTMIGNGTEFLAEAIVNSNSVGINSI